MLGIQETVEVASQALALANKGLVVTQNPSIQQTASNSLRNFSISSETCSTLLDFQRKLARNRYEVFIVDCDITGQTIPLIQELRANTSSRTAVVIAVTRSDIQSAQAFVCGAQFTVQVSLMQTALDRVLRAAYGMIVREQRRYFRCPIDTEFIAHRSTETAWKAKLVNISEGGFCFDSPVSLRQGEFIEAQIRLPKSSIELASRCQVQWTKENGRAGVRFLNLSNESKSDLQHWLARQLETIFPAIALAAPKN
ncbi:MAG TPA: PilZ domain-containing protein [Terriglobales bacterium]|nr:PilZ domain-containing protein [Terriglobales bacterium]